MPNRFSSQTWLTQSANHPNQNIIYYSHSSDCSAIPGIYVLGLFAIIVYALLCLLFFFVALVHLCIRVPGLAVGLEPILTINCVEALNYFIRKHFVAYWLLWRINLYAVNFKYSQLTISADGKTPTNHT